MDFSKTFGWKEIKCNSEGYKGEFVSRVLWADNEEKPKYKYAEKITFKESQDGKYAICIGLNPAKARKELDTTNKRIIKLLKEEYKGYWLLNMFPEITSNAKEIHLEEKENIEFCDKINTILMHEDFSDLDIVLFFGRSFCIPAEFAKSLREFCVTRQVYMTCHEGEFTHPGANASIKKEAFKPEYLRSSTCVRVKEK